MKLKHMLFIIALLFVSWIAYYLITNFRPWADGWPVSERSIDHSKELGVFIDEYEATIYSYDKKFDISSIDQVWTSYSSRRTTMKNKVEIDSNFVEINIIFDNDEFSFPLNKYVYVGRYYSKFHKLNLTDIYLKVKNLGVRKAIEKGQFLIHHKKDTILLEFNDVDVDSSNSKRKIGMIELVKK